MQRADAVALLHRELGRVADLGDAVGERGRDRERGDLVDHVRDLVALDRRAVQRATRARAARRPARRTRSPVVRRARCRRPCVAARRRNPSRVGLQRHRLDHEVGAGRDRGGDHEERGRRRVAGHVELERLAARPARHAHGSAVDRRPARRARRASARCDRGSARATRSRSSPSAWRPGEHQRRLHLRARDRQLVAQCRAARRRGSTSGASVAVVAAVDAGAHRAQRLDDPAHRPLTAATRRR